MSVELLPRYVKVRWTIPRNEEKQLTFLLTFEVISVQKHATDVKSYKKEIETFLTAPAQNKYIRTYLFRYLLSTALKNTFEGAEIIEGLLNFY